MSSAEIVGTLSREAVWHFVKSSSPLVSTAAMLNQERRKLVQTRQEFAELQQRLDAKLVKYLPTGREGRNIAQACSDFFDQCQHQYIDWRSFSDADALVAELLHKNRKTLDLIPETIRQDVCGVIRVCYQEIFAELPSLENLIRNLPQEIVEELESSQERKARQHALTLITTQTVKHNPDRISALLLADSDRAVPFFGRKDEAVELQTWCDDAAPIAVRNYAAKGGTGKTRLFLEMCLRFQQQGWQAGFLDDSISASLASSYVHLFSLRQPLLLVVDYAERQASAQLTPLFDALYNANQTEQRQNKVRIILLTRDNVADSPDSDWVRQLRDNKLFYKYKIRLDARALASIAHDEASRRAFLLHACQHFANVLGKPERDLEALCAQQDLSPSYLQRALYLEMLALWLLLEGTASRQPSNEDDLLDHIIERERRFLDNRLAAYQLANDFKAVWEAFIVFTACKDLSEADADALLHAMPRLRDASSSTRNNIAELLHEVYGRGEANWIAPELPDLVIEQLYGDAFVRRGSKSDALLELMLDHAKADTLQVLNHLNALAQRRRASSTLLKQALQGRMETLWQLGIDVATSAGDPIGKVMAEILAQEPNLALARKIYVQIHYPTTVLRELAAVTCQQLYEASESAEKKARLANDLSVRLGALGKREAGLAAIEEAVEIRRELARERPEVFLPDLARSLNNLSNCLGELGKHEAGLAAIEEAVEKYRELAQERPEVFLPDLAASLNNLSVRLGALGKREAGLAAIKEAVEIRRELAQERPEVFLPDLAASLNNLSNRLGELGKREAGLAAIEEAVEKYRELAQERPEVFLPNLASSLNNFSVRLGEIGKREASLAAIEEAVEKYRELAQERPEVFLPDLASSLGALTVTLMALDKRQEALVAITEAVTIIAPFYQKQPQALANLSRRICYEYKKSCEALNQAPDATLLAPFASLTP